MDEQFDGKFDPRYAKEYSEEGFWEKALDVLKVVGAKVIYEVLLLFYAAQNPNCPMNIKTAIYATLGYFISPLDLIPDITPVIGFSDDIMAIGAALAMAHMFIDDNVSQQAKDTMCRFFGKDILAKI